MGNGATQATTRTVTRWTSNVCLGVCTAQISNRVPSWSDGRLAVAKLFTRQGVCDDKVRVCQHSRLHS